LLKASVAAVPAADGSVTVRVPIESIGNAAFQFIRLGADLEVLKPAELRSELARLARSVLDLYES
jgi:predicted DNA-binding transcriptional regulator YafY